MRVLMFGWEFPPHITGGLGTACYGLSKALAEQGTDIIFVVPKIFGDEEKSQIKLKGAESVGFSYQTSDVKALWENLSYLEIGSTIIPYMDPEEFGKLMKESKVHFKNIEGRVTGKTFNFSGIYGADLLEEVSRYALIAGILAKENEFDVIHSHDWLTYLAGISAKKVSKKPLIIHVHATEFDRSGDNVNKEVFKIEKLGMDMADKIITVSNLTRKTVIDKYGINPDKIVTVHNAVEPFNHIANELEQARAINDKIVTFLGRITFQKGPEYFIEAAYKVLQHNSNVRFVMAGTGDMMNRMIKRVAKLGISTRFHFTGFLKGDEVVRMFNLSDVYVMPSVSEPFGISPLEAMSSNVPVIISKQSGVSEILHHAIKVDFWDIDAMADAINGLLNYRALSKTFKELGKDEVLRMKWETSARKVQDVYESAL